MSKEKRFLVDVGMKDLPFPIKADSRVKKEGQDTIANISISARIMSEFEAGWIDKFIQIVHDHRERIGTKTLSSNIMDYVKELQASTVKIDFDYPFFYEKRTPVSKEKCLVRYLCTYSVRANSLKEKPKVVFKIDVPCITTYPASFGSEGKGLFGQLSVINIEVEPQKELYPENLVDIVDRHALVPVYSFLTKKDQEYVIEKVHSEKKTSVVVLDEIKNDLAKDKSIDWYALSCSNYGMLHSYSTLIKTEKSMWVPVSNE